MDLSDKIPAKRGRIEIVPLIDCMFLLLVFFVYSMMTMTQPRGVPVSLPHASTASTIREEPLAVSITEAGEIFLDKEQVCVFMSTPVENVVKRGEVSLVLDVYVCSGVEQKFNWSTMKSSRRKM